jgi:hypothetical protein
MSSDLDRALHIYRFINSLLLLLLLLLYRRLCVRKALWVNLQRPSFPLL